MIKIRTYFADDKEALNDIAVQAFYQYKGKYLEWGKFQIGIGKMADLSDCGRIIVAESEGAIIGGVAYIGPGINPAKAAFFDPDWAIMRMLVVAPRARGLGAGKLLANECIKYAMGDGARTFALHTSPIMKIALPMYIKMGFALHSKAPQIYGVDYNVYTLDLTTLKSAQQGDAPKSSSPAL